jgi:hypothetical protein
MRKSKFSEEQIINLLKSVEAGQRVADLTLDNRVLKDVISKKW